MEEWIEEIANMTDEVKGVPISPLNIKKESFKRRKKKGA